MPSPKPSPTSSRLPEWLRIKLPRDPAFARTRDLVADLGLNTVCQGARCPNICECFARSTATFLILGRSCTRSCAFCNIGLGKPEPVDPGEPARVAEAARRLGLAHAVVTSVTRDDLPDGGAAHFAAAIRALREALPLATVEVLIPDFRGDEAALRLVLDARPDVLNHNVETVPGLYQRIRPQADYGQSLQLLERAAKAGLPAKSGLMAGFGESMEEVRQVIRDLHARGVTMITIGQYLRPSKAHPEPVRYVHPDEFAALAAYGRALGVPHMFCAPLVRSSYHAGEFVKGPREGEREPFP
ncbi:MAG: lipoyl synthase, partial [Thermodesulfobacteriota bacterium]